MLPKIKTSKGELLLREYLKIKYHWVNHEYNVRPDWLKWETGHNLELDVFIPELQLAFEFNGEHHLKDLEQKRRDVCKREKCEAKGIRLYTFSLQTLYTYAVSHKHNAGKYEQWFLQLELLLKDYRSRFPRDKTIMPTYLPASVIREQRPRGKQQFVVWKKRKFKKKRRYNSDAQDRENEANKARAIYKLFHSK